MWTTNKSNANQWSFLSFVPKLGLGLDPNFSQNLLTCCGSTNWYTRMFLATGNIVSWHFCYFIITIKKEIFFKLQLFWNFVFHTDTKNINYRTILCTVCESTWDDVKHTFTYRCSYKDLLSSSARLLLPVDGHNAGGGRAAVLQQPLLTTLRVIASTSSAPSTTTLLLTVYTQTLT